MKKMISTFLTVGLFLSLSAQTFTGWKMIPAPNFGAITIQTLAVKTDGTILAFDSARYYVSSDLGKSWTEHPSPLSDWPAITTEFKGKVYLAGDGLRSTEDNINWETGDLLGYFYSFCHNDTALFAFGEELVISGGNVWLDTLAYKTYDGQQWLKMEVPGSTLTSSYALGDSVFVLGHTGVPGTPRYFSPDNGDHWNFMDTVGIGDLGASSYKGHYAVVGWSGIGDGDIAAIGDQYNFSWSFPGQSGWIGSVEYVGNDCYMSGAITTLSGEFIGFVIKNGNQDSIAWFPSPVSLASNHELVVAYDWQSNLYTLANNHLGISDGSGKVEAFQIYPNPTTGSVTVQTAVEKTVGLYGLQISAPYHLQPGKNTLDLSNLPPGIYFLGGQKIVKL